MNKKLLATLVALVAFTSFTTSAQAALSEQQIQAILSLLSSFGADSTTIANVNSALIGGTTTVPPRFCYDFNKDLTVGSRGDGVSALKTALTASGIAVVPTVADSYFGEDIAANVVSFQKANRIRQTGYVGPLTRAKLNALYGCHGNIGNAAIKVDVDGGYFLNVVYSNIPVPANIVLVGVGNESVLYRSVSGSGTAEVGVKDKPSGTYYLRVVTSETGRELVTSNKFDIVTGEQNVSFSASPTYGAAPLLVTFSYFGLEGGDYKLDFGDGQSQPININICKVGPCPLNAIQPPKHTYTSAGTYTAKLIYQPPYVCNPLPGGACAEIAPAPKVIGTVTITVSGTQPVTFTATPQSGTAPLEVTFSWAQLSSAVPRNIDFGDDQTMNLCSIGVACTQTAHHTYTSPGTYTAVVYALVPLPCLPNLQCGAEKQIYGTATITVTGTNMGGSLTASPTSGNAPLAITFLTRIPGNRPAGMYVLDFGDGKTEEPASCPNEADSCTGPGLNYHTYTAAGTYTAQLIQTIDNCAGWTSAISCTLPVEMKIIGRVTITVTGVQPTLPTLTFTANPSTINAGEQTTIAWSSANATSCYLMTSYYGPGEKLPKSLSGQETMKLSLSGTFTMTCAGSGGSVTKSATVIVATPTTLTPFVRVITPNGGEQISLDQPYIVKWSGNGINKVTVAVYKNDQLHKLIVKDMNSPTGPFESDQTQLWAEWMNEPTGQNVYKIYIEGRRADGQGTVADMSDAPFGFTSASAMLYNPYDQLAGVGVSTLALSQPAPKLTYFFNVDLYRGMEGTEVLALQRALMSQGLLSGEITGLYLDQTLEAVIRFQLRYGVRPTGYVGPATRAVLNQLFSR